MKAYSPTTGTTYDSCEELLAEEANGYSVVSILSRTATGSRKIQTYARVLGPFDTKLAAQKDAARLRRRWKLALVDHPYITLVSISIEPIYKELYP